VAELINRLTHPTDLVALLSGSELAVLTIGVTRESRGDLLERLRVAVAEEVLRLLDQPAMASVAGGAATYPADGKEPGTLVQAARAARILGAPSRTRAA
jgi:GGDEF domain-containing protein